MVASEARPGMLANDAKAVHSRMESLLVLAVVFVFIIHVRFIGNFYPKT